MKYGDRIRKTLREAVSPTFLVIVMGAAALWFISKLGGEYTTEMEMGVRIDGQKYRLNAVVHGRGSSILAQQLSLKSRLNLTLTELSPRPSRETLGALSIAPASLAKAINAKITDLTIMEVTSAPEFTPPPPASQTSPSASQTSPSAAASPSTSSEEKKEAAR